MKSEEQVIRLLQLTVDEFNRLNDMYANCDTPAGAGEKIGALIAMICTYAIVLDGEPQVDEFLRACDGRKMRLKFTVPLVNSN